MDLNTIIEKLKAERDTLAAAIECLEQLAAGRARKRGRPPKWLSERGEGTQPSLCDSDSGIDGAVTVPVRRILRASCGTSRVARGVITR